MNSFYILNIPLHGEAQHFNMKLSVSSSDWNIPIWSRVLGLSEKWVLHLLCYGRLTQLTSVIRNVIKL